MEGWEWDRNILIPRGAGAPAPLQHHTTELSSGQIKNIEIKLLIIPWCSLATAAPGCAAPLGEPRSPRHEENSQEGIKWNKTVPLKFPWLQTLPRVPPRGMGGHPWRPPGVRGDHGQSWGLEAIEAQPGWAQGPSAPGESHAWSQPRVSPRCPHPNLAVAPAAPGLPITPSMVLGCHHPPTGATSSPGHPQTPPGAL